ncbi:MAG: TetR/AcrR family transcriptional regulator [Actinomycetota bacterium]|nr:TetR/AcrR family transcriptional regulator [Actinomycetota bacterium]
MTDASSTREPRRDALRNQRHLMRAATAAVHREGLRVPMGTIAADAGLGIGTLYRHFPNRDDLLSQLTHRFFEQVLANAHTAERNGATPIDSLRLFVEGAISQRNELVLPLHGGPPLTSTATAAVRTNVHNVLQRIIDRGTADGTLRGDVTAHDIVTFGAMLAQPRPTDTDWDATCRRLLATYLRGVAA